MITELLAERKTIVDKMDKLQKKINKLQYELLTVETKIMKTEKEEINKKNKIIDEVFYKNLN